MSSHVFLGVSDFDRALAFYDADGRVGPCPAILRARAAVGGWQPAGGGRPLLIGWPFRWRGASARQWPDAGAGCGLPCQVDAAWRVALAHGGMDEGAPDCAPSITRTITAPYFRDPDGNKLCVVCHPCGARFVHFD